MKGKTKNNPLNLIQNRNPRSMNEKYRLGCEVFDKRRRKLDIKISKKIGSLRPCPVL